GKQRARGVAAADNPEPCNLIPAAEIERLVGPLDGKPVREGTGCWYYVPMDTLSPEWAQLRASARRLRESGADDRAVELYAPTRAGLFVDVDVTGGRRASARGGAGRTEASPAGWDEVRATPGHPRFTGRAG